MGWAISPPSSPVRKDSSLRCMILRLSVNMTQRRQPTRLSLKKRMHLPQISEPPKEQTQLAKPNNYIKIKQHHITHLLHHPTTPHRTERTCSREYVALSMYSMCFDFACLHPAVRTQ